MQIQRVQNNNYNPKFKANIRFISPTGKTVTIDPNRIDYVVGEKIKTVCLFNEKKELGYTPILEHILNITKVVFLSSSTFVNAAEEEVSEVIAKAKTLSSDSTTLVVGKTLEHLAEFEFAKSISELTKYSKEELESSYHNTCAIFDKHKETGRCGDTYDLYVEDIYDHWGNTLMKYSQDLIKTLNNPKL